MPKRSCARAVCWARGRLVNLRRPRLEDEFSIEVVDDLRNCISVDPVDCFLVLLLWHDTVLEERRDGVRVTSSNRLLYTTRAWRRRKGGVGIARRANGRRQKLCPEHVGVFLHGHFLHLVMEVGDRRRNVAACCQAQGRVLNGLETMEGE